MKNYLFGLLFLTALVLYCCTSSSDNAAKKEVGDAAPTAEVLTSTPAVNLPADLLDGMNPPYDVGKNSSVLQNAIFAWREMIALSWKSTYTANNPQRATPDSSWSYVDGTPSTPLVWETYAHRIEYRPAGDVISKDFDSQPAYPFVNADKINWGDIDPSQHFVVLDEDNEIGSCYVFATPNITDVTPQDNLVMYMAKNNRAEYDYRKDYFNSNQKVIDALGKIKIDTTVQINLLKEISTYKDSSGNDPCGAVHFANQGIMVMPCSDEASQSQGAIEIKTAWRPLTAQDNPTEFLVRDAVSFTQSGEEFTAQVNQYVLIGMHIIHKTNNFRHFFIATWEHNSLESHGYQYVTIPVSPAPGEDYQILPVERHNSTDGANSYVPEAYGAISDAVQAQIRAANPNNFLANYRLAGFQSDVYQNSTLAERKKQMPAYYLANLVIESDEVLSNFSGSGIGTPFDQGHNIVAEGQSLTTGGCSGCHGVAQKLGGDFSFLNDTIGKPIPEPDPRMLSQNTIDTILTRPN